MKKITGLAVGLSLVFGFHVVASTNKNANNAETVEAIGNYSTSASTYYNDITASSGTQLAAQLHDLITSTHGYYTSYADNGANKYQQNTDQYYENGSKVSGYLYEFYSGVKWPNAWAATAGDTTGGYNREHCWCQSNSVNNSGTQMWGESGGGSDMHHLRPVEVRLNSTRSNNKYGEISNRDSSKVYAKYGSDSTYALGGYNSGGVFEPLDSKKGDVARIILYVYLHYNSYTNSTLFGSYGTTNGNGNSSYFTSSLLSLTKIINKSTESDALTLLLDWNTSDPVDEIEERRNEQVAKYQGNRNPFIDNSNYANLIWGTGSSTPTVNSVSVSPATLSLDLNGTTTGNLTATVNVSNGAAQTVTWSSSNTNVAEVSDSGVVTAKAKGSCTVTATSTVNLNKSASCSVSVTDSSSSGGGGSSSNEYSLYSGTLTEGDYVLTYGSYALKNTISSNRFTNGSSGTEYTILNSKITNPDSSVVWHIAASATAGYWTIYNDAVSKYAGTTSTNNRGALSSTEASDYYRWSCESTAQSTTYDFINKGNSRYLRQNGENGWAAYSASTGDALTLYKKSDSGGSSSPLSSISLSTSNVETEFYVGDTFSYLGLVVTAYYENGTEDIVNPTSVSSPDMTTTGTKTITVTYVENEVTKTATYQITVVANTITGIEVDDAKTNYTPDSSFEAPTVYAIYGNGNEVDVTSNATFSGYNLSVLGDQTVTVTYVNGSTFTTSYTITVSNSLIATYDFTKNFSTYASSWGNTYSARELNGKTDIGGEFAATINLGLVSKQSSNIDNMPVHGDQSTGDVIAISFELTETGYELDDVSVTFEQWTTKTPTMKLFKGTAATGTALDSGVIGTKNTISSSDVGGTTFVVACNDGGTTRTQVGLESITISIRLASELSSVTSTGHTTTFTNGNSFSYGGTLTAHYTNDKADATVTPTYFKYGNSGINPTTSGTALSVGDTLTTSTHNGKYVYVVYTESGISKYTSYQIAVNSDPSLVWDSPTINVYSGTSLTSTTANSWGVKYNNGSGSLTNLTYGQFSVKLGGTTISLSYSWQPEDDGKTLCVSYNSLTTSTVTVSVVQSLRPIMIDVMSSTTRTWTATAASNLGSTIDAVGNTDTGSLTFDDSSTMSYTRTLEYLASGKSDYLAMSNGYIQFGSSNALETLELSVSNSSTVTQVQIYCWAKNGATDVTVKVGGSVFDQSKSAPSAAGSLTFSGSASGNIVITMEKSAKTAGCAQYIYSVAITTSSPSGTQNIANVAGHEDAQRAVVKFAKAFNTALGGTSYCTTNLSSAWSTANSAWDTFLSEAEALGSTEEAYAKSLIANATAQWTEGTDSDYSYCLERCLATYEKCVTVHGQTAFMSAVRSVSSSNHVSPIVILTSKTNSIAVIVIISMVSMTAIGGYFFIRKRKEN